MIPETCQRCGTPLPAEAAYCPACGAPVAGAAAPEERKVVTVLFADLAGSTELARNLDPERFREVMGEFYRMASDEVASLRGRTEKFVGDAVMAVFGLPLTHDDDALRGVRAGLSIRDRMARLGGGLRDPLSVRVGINTGPVVAATALAGDFMVSGASVNLAARLQQAAGPGEVLAGELTWELTRHAVEFGPPKPVRAKGFGDEVEGFPVVSLTTRSSRRTIPLVGRRRELTLLTETFERTVETGRAHLVTIVGEAGIGKSRLVEELSAGLPEEADVLIGRASEFGEDPTFASLADMVRRRLGVQADTDPDEVRRRLSELVDGCCDPTETEQVAARLGILLGLGEEPREGNPYRAAEIRAGLTSLLAGLARSGPVVVVLEDLHLARPALLEVVDEAIRSLRRFPVLVVAVGREGLLDLRRGSSDPTDALMLRLEPLRYGEAHDLASAAGESLDEETARDVARHAGGNPFFIIETTGMLLHEAGEEPHAISIRHLLPPTVQAVVASRIDHLPERARELLRVASVFPGDAFLETKLALVTEVDPEVLETLEDQELIVSDPDRPGRWRFRHDMLHEVAYQSLSKRERRRLHEAVADGLLAGEDADGHAQQIAYHLEQAAREALDLDPLERDPARRAEEALRRAGDLSRWKMESRSAIDLYRRAIDLAGPREGWGKLEAWLLAATGEAHYWLSDYDQAEVALRRALEVGGDDLETRAQALRFLGDIALNIRGDISTAQELFDGALRAAREQGNPWALARTLLMAGWVPYWRADLEEATRRFQEALDIARANPEGDRWGEARALNSLLSARAPLTDPLECLALADQALVLGREMGDPFTIASAQENRGGCFRRMWRLDEARACLDEASAIYRDIGARWELASSVGERGSVHRLAGRLSASEADLREALRLCLDLGERALVVWTVAELSLTLLCRGDVLGARDVLDATGAPSSNEPGSRTSMLEAQAVVALAEDKDDLARELASESLEIERARGLSNWLDSQVWWAARILGPDLVGGEEEAKAARKRLEANRWIAAINIPDQLAEVLRRVAGKAEDRAGAGG